MTLESVGLPGLRFRPARGLAGGVDRRRREPGLGEGRGAHPRSPIQGGEWFSLEFRTRTAVPEWGDQLVSMMREEDMKIPASGALRFLAGPQMELWIIGN